MLFWGRCEDTQDLFPNSSEQRRPEKANYKFNVDRIRAHVAQHGYAGINVYEFREIIHA